MDNPVAVALKRTARAARQRLFQREFPAAAGRRI
jgi:hypothetical protein